MKILLSIFINALILFLMTYLLGENSILWLEKWISIEWWLTAYLAWGIILGLINITIKPILNLLSIPLFFVFFWLVVFFINAIVLKMLNYIINSVLIIPWVSFDIIWTINFIIAVLIFTILNILFNLIWFKTK
jgi:putative membrane protein